MGGLNGYGADLVETHHAIPELIAAFQDKHDKNAFADSFDVKKLAPCSKASTSPQR
jgi:hypothetical protein